MKIRILERDNRGELVRSFVMTYPTDTKKATRRMARREFPLPRYTLGQSWKAEAVT